MQRIASTYPALAGSVSDNQLSVLLDCSYSRYGVFRPQFNILIVIPLGFERPSRSCLFFGRTRHQGANQAFGNLSQQEEIWRDRGTERPATIKQPSLDFFTKIIRPDEFLM